MKAAFPFFGFKSSILVLACLLTISRPSALLDYWGLTDNDHQALGWDTPTTCPQCTCGGDGSGGDTSGGDSSGSGPACGGGENGGGDDGGGDNGGIDDDSDQSDDCPTCSDCEEQKQKDGQDDDNNDDSDSSCPKKTGEPVQVVDGAVTESATDMVLPGSTFGFTLSRNYDSLYYSNTHLYTPIGAKWQMDLGGFRLESGVVEQGEYDIVFHLSTEIKRTFTYIDGTNWEPPAGYNVSLVKTTAEVDVNGDEQEDTVDIYVMTMLGRGEGYKYTFFGFSGESMPASLHGKIWKKTDRYGEEVLTYNYNTPGTRIASITSTQGWLVEFGYPSSLATQIQTVTAYDGPTTSDNIIARVTYYYWQGGEGYSEDTGWFNDLIGVHVEKADSDGNLTLHEWTQYRYYTDMTGLSDLSSVGSTDYFPHNDSHYLKAVYDSAAIARIAAHFGVTWGTAGPAEFMQLDDTYTGYPAGPQAIEEFATRSFEYYNEVNLNTGNIPEDTWGDHDGGENMHATYGTTDQDEIPFDNPDTNYYTDLSGAVFRVKSETVSGGCSSCGADPNSVAIRRTYYYMTIGNEAPGVNDVTFVTVEDSQDSAGNWLQRRIWGSNSDKLLLRQATLVNEGGTIKYWCDSFIRGTSDGSLNKVVQHRTPAAHTAIGSAGNASAQAEAFRKFLNPTGNSGSNDTITVNPSNGLIYVYDYNTNGYQTAWKAKNGASETAYFTKAVVYGDGETNDDEPTILPIETYSYASPTTTMTVGALTEYEYVFHDDDTDTQLKVRITKLPIVNSTQNGPGEAGRVELYEYFDIHGRLRWEKDGEGSVTYYSYHPDTGELTYMVQDVDTSSLPSAITNGSPTTEPKYVAWDENSGTAPFATSNSNPLHLVTVWEYDTLGREIQRIDPSGVKHFTRYEADQTIHFPFFDDATDTVLQPIQITKTNNGGQVIEQIDLDPSKAVVTNGRPAGLDTYTQADYIAWTKKYYDASTGKLAYIDRYHTIPASGDTIGTHFYRTKYKYDTQGRLEYLIEHVSGNESTGTWQITRISYDGRARRVKIQRVVSDEGIPSDTVLASSTFIGETLATISETLYDGVTSASSTAVGNGYLTQVRSYHDTNQYTGSRVYRTYRGHVRGLEPIYDSGSGLTVADGPYTVGDVDWRGRLVATAQYKSVPTWTTVLQGGGYTIYANSNNATYYANRGTLARQFYDDMGRVYRADRVAVDASSGAAGNILRVNGYYNRRSQLVGVTMDGRGGREYAYDSLGRQYQSRTVTTLDSTLYNATTGAFIYCDPAPVPGVDESYHKTYMTGGNDGVLALDHVEFDDANNVLRAIHWATLHDDTDGLEAKTTPDDYIQTSAYGWYDAANRLTTVANYGTNDTTFTYAGLPTRSTSAPASSSSSDAVPVTTYDYDVALRTLTITDPTGTPTTSGVETVVTIDALSRTIRLQEAEGETEERDTIALYNGLSNMIKLIADLNNDGDEDATDQVTEYTYGNVYNASLLTETAYPDSQSSSDVVAFTYHIDGTPATRTDQRGAELTFSYDNNRRMIGQDLTTIGGADDSTGKIEYTYDALGRREKITSYDSAGTPVVTNEVQYAYTDYGALKTEYQAHGGLVDTGATGSPRVDYVYDESAGSSLFTKALRLTDIVYPASTDSDLTNFTYRRNVQFNYAAGISADTGRPSEIRDDNDGDLASFAYLGDGAPVRVAYDTPQVALDYVGGAPGTYAGFDRFGRVIDHKWYDAGASADRDRLQYTYDRNSNRILRDNTLTTGLDEAYAYDKLNRLTVMNRGTFGGSIVFAQQWGLSILGNWDTFKQDNDGDGSGGGWDLEQARDHNIVNEIDTTDDHGDTKGASITATTGDNWFDPVYDAAGNMTQMPKPSDPTVGYTAVYDAWNRMVEVKDSSNNTIAKYGYDGVGRRIVKDVYASGSHDHCRHYYFSGWRIIEERIDSATLADKQYVWGLRYIDDLVLRDRQTDDNANTGDLGTDDSGLDERLYALQDANYNVTTLADVNGDAVERYSYTPYGERTIYDASYNVRSSSSHAWDVGHQGLFHDSETGLIYNRNRMLHAQLGRFLQRDPLGYVDGMSVYEYVGSDPMNWIDPSGLSEDTYVIDKEKHGDIHIDRYNKARQNIGRYRLDGTPIPHKGVVPDNIPKADLKRFSKLAAKAAKFLGKSLAIATLFLGDPLEATPLHPAQMGGPSRTWYECKVKSDIDDCYCEGTGKRNPNGDRTCVYDCIEISQQPMIIPLATGYVEEYKESIGCKDPDAKCENFIIDH